MNKIITGMKQDEYSTARPGAIEFKQLNPGGPDKTPAYLSESFTSELSLRLRPDPPRAIKEGIHFIRKGFRLKGTRQRNESQFFLHIHSEIIVLF